MHPVALAFQPVEEAVQSEPPVFAPPPVAFDDPRPLVRREVAPRGVGRHPGPRRLFQQIALVGEIGLRLQGFDRAATEAPALVRDHEPVVDAHLAAEPAAGLAGADRGVEGEQVRDRVPVGDLAARALEAGREPPRGLRGVRFAHRGLRPPPAGREGGFEGLHQARAVAGSQPQPVLDHHQLDRFRIRARIRPCPRSRASAWFRFRHKHLRGIRTNTRFRLVLPARPRPRLGSGPRPFDPGIALPGEVPPDFVFGKAGRRPYPEADGRALAVRFAQQAVRDALRRVAAHLLPAAAAMEPGEARIQQLQVVVDLRHGADRGPGGADLVGLVHRDGGRDAVDPVRARPVHAVEELAGVGGEGLDVAALALGVHRVEGEGGLPGAADPGDDDELAQGKVEVEPFQVVLAGSADGDDALGTVTAARPTRGRGFHSRHYTARPGARAEAARRAPASRAPGFAAPFRPSIVRPPPPACNRPGPRSQGRFTVPVSGSGVAVSSRSASHGSSNLHSQKNIFRFLLREATAGAVVPGSAVDGRETVLFHPARVSSGSPLAGAALSGPTHVSLEKTCLRDHTFQDH